MKKSGILMAALVGITSMTFAASLEAYNLKSIRDRVALNESLLDPICLEYTVRFDRKGESPSSTGGGLRRGRSYSHYTIKWAQSGQRHYIQAEYYFSEEELASRRQRVLEGHCVTFLAKNDPPFVSIGLISSDDWSYLLTTKMGLRPFGGEFTLSEVLIPELATLASESELMNDQQACVVDVRHPGGYLRCVRIWISPDKGVPLKIQYFDEHPTSPHAKCYSQVGDIKLHALSNGGWLPIKGTRSLSFSANYSVHEHISVDCNSLMIEPSMIPDSLFTLDYPDGTAVYDQSSGLTTYKGQPLKTFDQITHGTDPYIAGVIVNEANEPVPDVVVYPFMIETALPDGSNSMKLIQPYERNCARTDNQGRFALILEEQGNYTLCIYPKHYLDTRVSHVHLGDHDVKIVLSPGGTISGRVFRQVNEKKVPAVGLKVTVTQPPNTPPMSLRTRNLPITTDSQGYFEIQQLHTSRRRGASETIPCTWRIACGETQKDVQFTPGQSEIEVELVLEPDVRLAAALKGQSLPTISNLGIDMPDDQLQDQALLVCFFDYSRRPDRHMIQSLAKSHTDLSSRAQLLAIDLSDTDAQELQQWCKNQSLPFMVHQFKGDVNALEYQWVIRSLPWLILTDDSHKVVAEGQNLDEILETIGL